MDRAQVQIHHWAVGAAAALALIAGGLVMPAQAQPSGVYTTTGTSTSTSSTDAVTGVTTTTTNSSTTTPAGIYRSGNDRSVDYWRNARNSGSNANWRDRAARDEDASPDHTSDLEARFPYDNTNGRHRSDVDAARTGFDDPRNPWDGRYANDNPSNDLHSNDKVNGMRGNEESRNLGNDRYRPGRYGTRSARRH